LVPSSLRAREIWALAPDFVLLYHIRRGFDRLITQLTAAGIQFGVLDNEGGVWPELASYTEMLIPDPRLRAAASFVCTWGKKIAEHIVRERYFTSDQVVITGCPRLDFYHSMWQAVLGEPETRETNAHTSRVPRQRILINTNYSEANPRFTPIEGVIAHLCDIFGWPASRALALIETQQQTLDATIQLVCKLANDYQHTQIIVRPHPFEGTEIYRSAFGQFGNVELNLSGPVQSQIFRAAAVVQRTSTTAIETSLAGVPALAPMWIPVSSAMPVVESVSVQCQSYNEMRTTLDMILSGHSMHSDTQRQTIDTIIQDWFYQIDGLAHRRVGQAILSRLADRRRVDEALCARYLHGLDGTRRPARAQMPRMVRHRIGLSPDWSFRQMRSIPDQEWAQTDQYFDAAGARNLLDRVLTAHQAAGQTLRPIRVAQARDQGDYQQHYFGHSVTLSCEP
jgi:surface carbohydrate biosynthesis protein